MKNVIIAFYLLISSTVLSQAKHSPLIKQGSKLNYLIAIPDGNSFPLTIILDSVSSQYMKWGWVMSDGNKGSWIAKKNSLENANQGWWSDLEPNSEIALTDNQMVGMFSKALWNAIQKDKKVTFDMLEYNVKSPSEQQRFKMAEKEINIVFLEGSNSTSKIWILNNPSFPLIVKIEGNPAGPDIALQSVE